MRKSERKCDYLFSSFPSTSSVICIRACGCACVYRYVFVSSFSHLEMRREMEDKIEIKRDAREIGVVAR